MKEIIFHPEARAEMRESFDFSEARLGGLGLRFLSAVEQTAERISTHPEAGAPLTGEFRKRIAPGFPYSRIYRVWQDYIYIVPSLTITVVRAIGGSEQPVASSISWAMSASDTDR